MDACETVKNKSNHSFVETQVPARLDRLPWSGWHWMIVTALGVYLTATALSGMAWNFWNIASPLPALKSAA